MNRYPCLLVKSPLRHLYLSDGYSTFRIVERGPPKGVPTFIWSFKCHLWEKSRICGYPSTVEEILSVTHPLNLNFPP